MASSCTETSINEVCIDESGQQTGLPAVVSGQLSDGDRRRPPPLLEQRGLPKRCPTLLLILLFIAVIFLFFFKLALHLILKRHYGVCVCVPVLVPFHQLRFDRFLSCRRSLLAFVDWPWRRHRRHLALKKRTVWPLSGAAVGGPLKFDVMNDGGFLSLPPCPHENLMEFIFVECLTKSVSSESNRGYVTESK